MVENESQQMYKSTSYSGYQNKMGRWLPTTMTLVQKHEDDTEIYSSKTTYTYDERGNILSTTIHAGTSKALTTTYTYDTFGNVLSMVSTGSAVKPITQYTEYDTSGRFVTKRHDSTESATSTYTYDDWGNVLTENDISDPSSVLTITHTYDNWGRLTSSKDALGLTTSRKIGWGDNDSKKFYVLDAMTGKPWILTWYDNAGHEMSQESFGPMNVRIYKSLSYDNRGLVTRSSSSIGRSTLVEEFSYDAHGRVLTDKFNYGKEISYSYGNRSVTTTINGRSTTKTTDAWGNLRSSTDALGGEVRYIYKSIGKPSRIISNGTETSMEYDQAGNRTLLIDPDAGRTTSAYTADGKLISATSPKGIASFNLYDNMGRIERVQIGPELIYNTYGSVGREKMLVSKRSWGDNSIEYTYDKYGRVLTEKRNLSGEGSFSFDFQYDDKSRLSTVIFPGGLEVSYEYDDYGFKKSVKAAGKEIYSLKSFDGIRSETSFRDSLTMTISHDIYGFEKSRELTNNKNYLSQIEFRPQSMVIPDISLRKVTLDKLEINTDRITGNLLSRHRRGEPKDTFEYDILERLISVQSGTDEVQTISYSDNGNILSKSGIGTYSYNSEYRPHAVTYVDNPSGMPTDDLTTLFNDFGKIQSIERPDSALKMNFIYGPDLQRWSSTLEKDNNTVRTVFYARNYEKIMENGTVREFYYLDGNTIVIRENGGDFKPYFAFTDNLGSILSVFDEQSTKVFHATYDPWGLQTSTLNTIGLPRGYTGHEMLNEFDIINMNGRLYDPLLGRFFSPDNYVQFPGLTQSFNRYSYCLNNPLKYTDPSGEIAELIGFAAGATASGIGSFAQSVKLNPGHLVLSSAAIGGVVAWATGGDFLKGALQGMRIGLFNHTAHPGELYYDSEGNLRGDLKEFVCYGKSSSNSTSSDYIGVIAEINTVADCLGTSLKNNSGNSTIGNNGKLYFHSSDQRGFNGNQYVKTIRMSNVGSSIVTYTGNANYFFGAYDLYEGISKDISDYKAYGYTDWYNTVRVSSGFVCCMIGEQIGLSLGAGAGASWGTEYGVPGIVSGSIVVGFIGGLAGAYVGNEIGKLLVDYNYGKIQ